MTCGRTQTECRANTAIIDFNPISPCEPLHLAHERGHANLGESLNRQRIERHKTFMSTLQKLEQMGL